MSPVAKRIGTAAWRQACREVAIGRAREVLTEANTTGQARLSQDWPQVLGRMQAAVERLLEALADADVDAVTAQRDAVAGRFTDLVEGLGRRVLVELLEEELKVSSYTAEFIADALRRVLDVEQFEGRIVSELSDAERAALGYTVQTVVGGNSATYRVFHDPDGFEVSPDTYLPPGVVAQASPSHGAVSPDAR